MKLKTLNRIIDWVKQYQPHLTEKEGLELYNKLVEEEEKELEEALGEQNLVEYLDAIGDVLWVEVAREYFNYDLITTYGFAIENVFDNLSILNFQGDVDYIIDDLINEIADSNFSKSYELQTEGEKVGKVVKGPDFKKPDIQKIIDKFNISF